MATTTLGYSNHVRKTLAYYEENYESITFFQDESKPKHVLSALKTCRFCDRKEPEVKFGDECHALANLIGNRRLFSGDECETCNRFFGKTIEDHFGKWSLPYRTISCVRGKEGFPSMARPGWRIESSEGGFEVKMFTNHQIAQIDEETKTIYLPLPRDAYIPIMVYKAFVRMAIAMLPRERVSDFQHLLTWLQVEDPIVRLSSQIADVLLAEHLSFPARNSVAAILFQRKTPNKDLPYLEFVLAFSNYAFQCMIPGPEGTENLYVKSRAHPLLTGMLEPPVIPKVVSLEGNEKVKGEIVRYTIGAESIVSRDITWHENVATQAYYLWENEDRVDGCDQKHWFEAEQLIRAQAEVRREEFFNTGKKKKRPK